MENGDVIIDTAEHNKCNRWWKRRTKNERKAIFCILGFLSTILIALAVYFFYFAEKIPTCKTADCQEAASDILRFIDESQKPCDDFYRFACGAFLQNTSFDDPFMMQSVKIMMQEEIEADINKMLEEDIDPEDPISLNQAKEFYRACMNEQAIDRNGLTHLLVLFKQMGGWPILEGEDWDPESFSWINAVRNLRVYGVNSDFFFNVTVDVDKENPERYILGIHDKFFSPSQISSKSKKTFLDYMVDVASQFNVKIGNLRYEMGEVLEFLLSLGKISEESKRLNKTNLYNLQSLADLQGNFPAIPWVEYLQGVLRTSADLTLNDVINVSEPVYLKKLGLLLKHTKPRVIANFMGWHIVQSLINYLPSKILNRAYEYLKQVNGQFYRKPRWSVCVEATRERLSGPINVGYIERYFNEETRRNATELIRNVKHQFRVNLLMMDWLDEETKRRIMSMLASSTIKIYSDTDFFMLIQDNSIYDTVEINQNNLLKSVLNLDMVHWDLHYGLLRQPVKDEWMKTPKFISGLKVIYSPTDNVLKFPLGLFRGIYYNIHRPDYMNYGLLGTVLAHQISHISVEAEGRKVPESKAEQARLLHSWSSISINRYVKKLECLSDQYAQFELRDVENLRPNSKITREEDIADLAGTKVAYHAYLEKDWRYGRDPLLPGLRYSARQIFWISSALQFCSKYPTGYLKAKYSGNMYHHSPNEFRVNGPLQNLDEFSKDFGCPVGSYMNPEHKCKVW